MFRQLLAAGVAVAILASPALDAQTALSARFDTAFAKSLTGEFAAFVYGDPTYLVLNVRNAAGIAESWIVEGGSTGEILRYGWSPKPPAMLGQTLVVQGFPLKPDVALTLDLPHPSERMVAAAKARRWMHGFEVTLPDGRVLPFGSRN